MNEFKLSRAQEDFLDKQNHKVGFHPDGSPYLELGHEVLVILDGVREPSRVLAQGLYGLRVSRETAQLLVEGWELVDAWEGLS